MKTLLEMNRKVLDELGFLRGVTHAEFLRANSDGKFYFLEVAARVGGAYISDVIEAATGINLWREWARLEVGAGKQPYQLPPTSHDYAGVLVSLARQEHPDTSAYNDPEIVYRINKYHHAGFVLKSSKPNRDRGASDLVLKTISSRFSGHATRPRKAQLLTHQIPRRGQHAELQLAPAFASSALFSSRPRIVTKNLPNLNREYWTNALS